MDDCPLILRNRAYCVNLGVAAGGVFRPQKPDRVLEMKEKTESCAESRVAAKRHPERSRRLLIDATLDSIAEDGITDTTVSRIIRRAGLSRGMIHLHFGGKEKLLVAASEAMGRDYYREIDRQLGSGGDNPVAVVMAVIRADLSAELMSLRNARIWHALRGAAHYSPGIAYHSDTRDKRLHGMLRGAFDRIAAAEGLPDAPVLARDATFGTLALLEGMWTDFMAHPDVFSRDGTERIIRRFLAGLFPDHFDAG